MSSSRLLIPVTVCLLLAACARKPSPADARLVFVPFEYLGTAPDSAWIGSALAGIASVQTGSLLSPHVREAQRNRNAYVVEGYVTGQPGGLRVRALVRDETRQQTVRAIEARGVSAAEAASDLSRQLKSPIQPFSSSNPEAVKQYFSGRPDAALAADPKFGAAHVARLDALIRAGNRAEIAAAAEAAKSANLSDLDRAKIQAMTAETPQARAVALLALARTAPYDPQLWQTAADAALTAKDHKGAVEAFQKILESEPRNVIAWNTLGYAQAFAGDLEGAKRSLGEYRKLLPKDANALDSLGEAHFYHARFEEAERYFLEAFDLNNASLAGGELYRAALSRFLAGDAAKADQHMKRYLEFRRSNNDAATGLHEAVWLYTTGRREMARQKAEQLALPAAKAQLAIWNLFEGKGNPAILNRPEWQGWKLMFERRPVEATAFWRPLYEGSSLIAGNEARVMLAWALTESGHPDESRTLLEKWPLPPPGPEAGLASLPMTKAIELKIELKADRR